MAGTSRYGRDELRKWCLYFFHRTTPSHVHPVTELTPGKTRRSRSAAPSEPLLEAGESQLLFQGISAAQRSDRGHARLLSGQQELFTRKISEDRVTGQVSEQVTLRKAVFHFPRARMCQAREKKAFLERKSMRSEAGREAWKSGTEQSRAAAGKHVSQALSRAEQLQKWDSQSGE